MKALLTFIFALLYLSVEAASPLYSQFDTNNFVSDALVGYLRANTNSDNPKALATKGDLAYALSLSNSVYQSKFDAAGSATAATNSLVATNDARAVNLTNPANQFRGNSYGIFRETNAAAGAGFKGVEIGNNVPNSFVTSGTIGNENLTQRLPPNGFLGEPDDNSGVLWWVGKNHTVTPEDMAWRFSSRGTSTRNDAVTTLMQGAPVTLEAPYFSGSASSMMDQPARGPEMWNRKPHPWIGVHTAMTGETGGVSASNWRLYQKVYTNLPNVALWFRTSGVASALSPYGVQIGVWGDTGAFTNRTSGGSLQMDPAILTACGITTVSNYTLALHTNGVKLSLANYRTTIPVDVWKGDTGRVQTNGIAQDVGFPSDVVGNGPVWAVIAPSTIDDDILFYYTNHIDELFVQDGPPFVGLAGYEQQLEAFSYRSTYLDGAFGQHIYWKDFAGGGQINDTTFPGTGDFTNALVLGWFANHPNTQTPFMINDWTPDQAYAPIGNEQGLAQSMSRFRTFYDGMKEWPDVPVFPLYALVNLGNASGLSLLGLTNALSVAEMGHGNLYLEVDTNAWSWNTNLNPILTNSALYLATWQDNALQKPVLKLDDGTNSVWIRAIDNGNFLVLAANQSLTSSNFSVNLNGVKGLATNVVFNCTNVLSQDAFGTGFITNNFIATVGASNTVYIRLTPALPQTRVFGFSGATVGTTNRPDGGVDYGINVTAPAAILTNSIYDTNLVVSTNNWNWPGPTNSLDWARGTVQRYHPSDTTPLSITNFVNFPAGQVAPMVLWVENTNTSSLSVKLPSPCEATNSLGGLTVSVNASNRLAILFNWSPLSTNALFSDQQLIK